MKTLFATCLLATTVSSAFAATDRSIYDIMYLPKADTTYGFSTGSVEAGKIKDDVDSDTHGFKLEQTIGHAFTDSFSAEVSANYMRMKTDPDQGDTTTNKGFSDPTVRGRYRVMDIGVHQLDILAGALLSLGDRKYKSDGDSNNVLGGNQYFLGAQFGQKTADYQWSFLLQYKYHDVTYYDEPGSINNKTDGYNSGMFRADLLNRITEKSFVRTHAFVNVAENNFEPDFFYRSSTQTYEVGAEYQHLCSENFLARAGVDYYMKDIDAIDGIHALRVTVGANYQF